MQFNGLKQLCNLAKDWRLMVYNAALIFCSPYLLFKRIRNQLARRHAQIFRFYHWLYPIFGSVERYPNDTSKGPHLIFLSGGSGELHTAQQLDFALKQLRPDIKTTWALGNPGLVKEVQAKHLHQQITVIPCDFIFPVRWWLRRLRPDLLVAVEELWMPNIVWNAKINGIPTLAVCARAGTLHLTGLKCRCYSLIYRWTLQGFRNIGFSSQQEVNLLKDFLPPDVSGFVTGRVKLSQLPKLSGESEVVASTLPQWLLSNLAVPLLIAGSTKDIEEEDLVLKAFALVRAQIPCALIIAPRRLHRVEELISLLGKFGIERFVRRSEYSAQLPPEAPEVYILDTLGELSSAYQYAQASYIGGTLREKGHNVIEPVEWGLSVCFGPGRGKRTQEQQICLDKGVGFCVGTSQELADVWLKVLRDEAWRKELGDRAQVVLQEQQQSLDLNVSMILETLNRLHQSTPPQQP